MFLTVLLYGQRRVPGYQWIGKYRKTKRVTYNQRLRQKYQAQHISRMEALLSTPYLTANEEACQVLAKERRNTYQPKWIRQKYLRWLNKENEVFNTNTR